MTNSMRSEAFRRDLLGFAWEQWSQMGILAEAHGIERRAADPEALLIFTLRVARSDPRLFDEVLDWLRLNAKLLSVQRLRNIASSTLDRRLVGAALDWASAHNPNVRMKFEWKGEVPGIEPLFSSDAMISRDEDPAFLSFGFSRPRLEVPSDKSNTPNLRALVNFAFKLRQFFGVGSRAEVVRFLLTTPSKGSSTNEVAWSACFAKRNVAETLSALRDIEVIQTRRRWNEDWHGIDIAVWFELLGVEASDPPAFMPWPQLLRAATVILEWLDRDSASTESDYIRASSARDLVEEIAADLAHAGIGTPPPGAFPGDAYLSVVDDLVAKIAGALNGPHSMDQR